MPLLDHHLCTQYTKQSSIFFSSAIFFCTFRACIYLYILTLLLVPFRTNPVPFLLNLFLFGLSLFLFYPQREQPSHLACVFFIYLVSFLPKTSLKKDTTLCIHSPTFKCRLFSLRSFAEIFSCAFSLFIYRHI